MKIDESRSRYHETDDATTEFTEDELKRLRFLLRRLRFLEQQIRDSGVEPGAGTGGQMFAEWEVDALRWTLTELGYLEVRDV